MINDGPLSGFETLAGDLLKPRYDEYSFAYISNTIEYMLTGVERGPLLSVDCFGGIYPRPKKTVLFLIDAFGWQFWIEHWQRYRTTRHVALEGRLTPISALFPSTTAASVATLNLGVLPAQHAFFEWNMYVPAYGEVIQSLPFCPLGARVSDGCLGKGFDPNQVVAVNETAHQRLGREGVRSILFAHQAYSGSAVNRIINSGAEIIRHSTLAEALVQLKIALLQTEGKAAFNFYWASIDSIGHTYGPGTPYHMAEIASFWRTFDDIFHDVDSADTVFMFTADHGQLRAKAEETIYINECIPEFANYLAVSQTGHLIYPGGAPRDVFLHVKPEYREKALKELQGGLGERALVLPMDAALEHGLFGPLPIGEELRRRIGDILILPHAGHFVWWREKGILSNPFNGHHGGLTAEELISVFGVVDTL